MVSLKLHRQRWQAKVRIPKALEASYGGKQYLYRHLPTSDRRTAKVEADAWEAMLRMEWSAKLGHVAPSTGSLRAFYEQLRREAESGELTAVVEGMDPVEAGIDLAIDRLADAVGERDLTDRESARLAALQDAIATVRGQTVSPRRELEPTFRELADDYITIWKTKPGRKDSNTEQQKQATFNLHPRLDWLKERSKSKQTGRIWPQFNPEGPGKKPGADAGKEFSRHKQARGFTDRRKVFHSFRNNVVGQLEEAGVPVTEIAQLVGHEKPFTLKKYNKRGLSLRRLSEIVELIAYLALVLPEPSALELPTA